MRKYLSVFVLAAAMVFGWSMTSSAQGSGDIIPEYGTGLTPQQLETARKIFNDNYADMDSTRRQLTAKRAELDAELASDNPNGQRIESLSREIGELRGKMLSAREQVRAQLRQNGLPIDYYGPRAPRGNWEDAPRGWHGYHHGRHYGPRGGWGMGMMGDWGMMGGWGCGGPCWR